MMENLSFWHFLFTYILFNTFIYPHLSFLTPLLSFFQYFSVNEMKERKGDGVGEGTNEGGEEPRYIKRRNGPKRNLLGVTIVGFLNAYMLKCSIKRTRESAHIF